MTLRWVVLHAIVSFVVIVGHAQRAEAVTCGVYGRRLLATQGPDIEFIAGTPSISLMRPTTAFMEDLPLGDIDCQLYARTFIPGVTVQQSYGGNCGINPFVNGDWVIIGQSQSHFPGNRSLWPINSCDSTPGVARIGYDGSSGAQQGFIEIGINHVEEGQIVPQTIGYVNVRIVNAHMDTSFVVTASASNIVGDSVALDHPLLNGKPNAVLFAQHYTSSAAATWNHPVALYYDGPSLRWRIQNQDGVGMVAGLEFFVRVDPTGRRIATAFFGQLYALTIDDPSTNFNPFAVIVASPVAAGNRRMWSPFHVEYNENDGYWRIVNSDLSNMPTSYWSGRAFKSDAYRPGFFVKINGTGHFVDDILHTDPSGINNSYLSNGSGVDVVAAGSLRQSGNARFFRGWCWTQNVITPVLTTFNATPIPGRSSAPPVTFQGTGINLSIGPLSSMVFNENGSTMSTTSSFNVWSPHRPDCP